MKKTLTLQPLVCRQVQMLHEFSRMNSPVKSFTKRRLGEGLSMECDQNVTENVQSKKKAKKIVSETSEHKKFLSRFFHRNSVGFPKGLIWRQKETQTICSGLPSLLYRVFLPYFQSPYGGFSTLTS